MYLVSLRFRCMGSTVRRRDITSRCHCYQARLDSAGWLLYEEVIQA